MPLETVCDWLCSRAVSVPGSSLPQGCAGGNSVFDSLSCEFGGETVATEVGGRQIKVRKE